MDKQCKRKRNKEGGMDLQRRGERVKEGMRNKEKMKKIKQRTIKEGTLRHRKKKSMNKEDEKKKMVIACMSGTGVKK